MSKTENVVMELKVPKAILDYVRSVGKRPAQYCRKAIVESVYMDLMNTPDASTFVKASTALAHAFEEQRLNPGMG